MFKYLFPVFSIVFLSGAALAADLPANNCEIFVKRIGAYPGSHNSGNVVAIVKVGWLGNDEHINTVRFHGYSKAFDLGNDESCHNYPGYDNPNWRDLPPTPGHFNTELGEYPFAFPTRSGSVASDCPGFHYTWIGAFKVETNKNTYWVNPQMDPDQHFHFDYPLFENVVRARGRFNPLSTLHYPVETYNPRSCQ